MITSVCSSLLCSAPCWRSTQVRRLGLLLSALRRCLAIRRRLGRLVRLAEKQVMIADACRRQLSSISMCVYATLATCCVLCCRLSSTPKLYALPTARDRRQLAAQWHAKCSAY